MKLLIVDVSNMFRMAWEAAQGAELSAAFNRTIDAINSARATYDRVIIACDSGASFRREIDPAYKANRTDPGEAYRVQIRRTVERLAQDGCVIIAAPKVGAFRLTGESCYAEADDVIGTVVAMYLAHTSTLSEEARAAWWLTIYSGDGDMEQLVNDEDGINIAKPASLGGGIFDEAKVIDKRGVAPAKIRDMKALCGDSSDNYKPFPGPLNEKTGKRNPGIGEAGAISLIKHFGSALAVFDDLDRVNSEGKPVIPANVRKLLDTHGRAAAERGLALATIRTDLTIDWSLIMNEPTVAPIATVADADLTAPPEVELAPPAPEQAEPAKAPVVALTTRSEPVSTAEAAPTAALATASQTALSIDPSTADWALSLQPRSASEAMSMAKFLMNSRLFTKLGTPEAIWAIILTGRERGISAMISLSSIDLVEGKPQMSADLIVAQVLRSGKAKKFTCVETTDERAAYIVQRFDDAEPMRVEFTKAHAVARGLWGRGTWLKMPDVMLAHRCATKAARLKFPDVTVGLYGQGEVREMHPEAIEAEFEAS